MKSLLFFISISFGLYAQVWESFEVWTPEWETKYSKWVESESVHSGIFHSKSSPYYGISVDCADTAYAFRAVFAFENNLPFKVKNPSYRPGRVRYYSNESEHSSWNKLSDPTKRLVKFVNMLGGFLGTETLSANDSYPIALDKIIPGDMFLYKIVKSDGVVRHAYNLKRITEIGLFDLIYSTQERKKNKRPLAHTKNQKLHHMPTINVWGFKRFITPENFEIEATNYQDFSLEQYAIAKESSMTDDLFFNHVQELLKQQEETKDVLVKRLIDDLCEKAHDRVDVVLNGYNYMIKNNNKCMSYTDFDTFSTPSRDGGLKEDFNKLLDLSSEIISNHLENELSEETLSLLEMVANRELDEASKEVLKEYCQINYYKDKSLDLNSFYWALKNNLVSSHPNDDIYRRWGQKSEVPKTTCKAFY